MYFKAPPWDILRDHPTLIDDKRKGLYALYCYDPYIEKIALGKIPSHLLVGEKLVVVEGKDVTSTWLEDNILTMDFFSSDQSYLVLFADELSSEAQEILQQKEIEWGRRYFVLSFLKDSKFFTSLTKHEDASAIKIEAPKFWETGKLLQFLCAEMRIKLRHDVQNYLIEATEPQAGLFIQSLKKVRLHGGDTSQLTVKQVKELVGHQKVDQFELAHFYGQKRWKDFFSKALDHCDDFDELIPLFSFLQSHLLKIADPSYMTKKNRLSKYDKNIEAQKTLWSADDVYEELVFLEKCERLAKTKSSDLVTAMRLRLIESYH